MPMWPLALLLILAGQSTEPQSPAAYAGSLDGSFEAMKRSAHVFCAGMNETPCVHDQAESIGWVKDMVAKGAWPVSVVADAIARNTRGGAVNWVGVKVQASSTNGAINQAELDAAERSLLRAEARRKEALRTTTECRTYMGKNSARTVCTSR